MTVFSAMDERPFIEAALRSIDLVFLELPPERAIPEGLMILGENIGAMATAVLAGQAGTASLNPESSWKSDAAPEQIFTMIDGCVRRETAALSDGRTARVFGLHELPGCLLLLVTLPTPEPASAFLAAVLPQMRLAVAEPVLVHCALSISATRSRLLAQQAKARAADEAQAARRIGDLLLARVGHEFRTPLVALAGISTVLEERGATMTPERRQAAYQLLRQNGERLSALVDKLMNVARIRAGRRPTVAAAVDFDAVLKTGETAMAGLLAGKSISFVAVRKTALPAAFRSDQAAILEILDNLLGNAAKFTAAGRIELAVQEVLPGTVARHSTADPGSHAGKPATASGAAATPVRVAFSVSDTGIGMDPALLGALDQPFHESRTGLSGETGSGLGLAIASGLVEQLGGVLDIRSAETGGTIISFTLPSLDSGASTPC
jgi:signal transduction histidine kinase